MAAGDTGFVLAEVIRSSLQGLEAQRGMRGIEHVSPILTFACSIVVRLFSAFLQLVMLHLVLGCPASPGG